MQCGVQVGGGPWGSSSRGGWAAVTSSETGGVPSKVSLSERCFNSKPCLAGPSELMKSLQHAVGVQAMNTCSIGGVQPNSFACSPWSSLSAESFSLSTAVKVYEQSIAAKKQFPKCAAA